MPPNNNRIHLFETDNRIQRIEGSIWESGYWVIGKDTANRLIGDRFTVMPSKPPRPISETRS
jgi:hypothetical protein